MTAGPDSVTVTPGKTALVASVTVPLMAPAVVLTVCARAIADAAMKINASSVPRPADVMTGPPSVVLLCSLSSLSFVLLVLRTAGRRRPAAGQRQRDEFRRM